MLRQPSIAPIAPADDPIHVLNLDERIALRRIERQAVTRAAIAGALSATASAIASILAHLSHPIDGANVSLQHLVTYWGWFGVVTLVASIVELGFLYWDALRAVHRMACAAGPKFENSRESQSDTEVPATLTRAALELPNPLTLLDGIDPSSNSRWTGHARGATTSRARVCHLQASRRPATRRRSSARLSYRATGDASDSFRGQLT